MDKVRVVSYSAEDLLKKSRKNHGSQYLTIIPQVAEEIQEYYPEYVQGLHDRVSSLELEVKHLKNQLDVYNYYNETLSIKDSLAEKLIIQFLKSRKQKGQSKINIFEIITYLRLPIDQIEGILDKLEAQDIISDAE